jgi:3-isopropylmalate/(R)-2-methylmalate dehydratase small subunit
MIGKIQEVHAGNKIYHFELDSVKKNHLIEGLDDIGLTLQHQDKISSFEEVNRKTVPWLYSN